MAVDDWQPLSVYIEQLSDLNYFIELHVSMVGVLPYSAANGRVAVHLTESL